MSACPVEGFDVGLPTVTAWTPPAYRRQRDAVSLGMPSFPDIVGRASVPAKESR